MPIPSLLGDDDSDVAKARIYLNTGGPLDLLNGKFIPGNNGNWVLSGGLGPTTAVIAEGNKFKSTLLNGASINVAARFPESEYFLNDTEFAIEKPRLVQMSTLYLDDEVKRAAHIAELDKRTRLYNPGTAKGETLDTWVDFMKELRDNKIKHYKDYEVEAEVLDTETMKPQRMLMPTVVGIDSWSEGLIKSVGDKNEEYDADTESGRFRSINMEEGLHKVRLMRQVQSICVKGGLYLTMSGHLGKKLSMDGKPNKKDMAFMGQDETVKGMGNKFYFAMSSVIKINNTQLVVDKNDAKQSDYPSKGSNVAGNELQRLMVTLVRTKNTLSGDQTTLVSSQKFGIMPGLSYYDFLRNSKYYGLGNPNKVRNPLLGDMNIGRTVIFDTSREYRVERALELTYQLFVIQSTWTLLDQPVNYAVPIDVFADKLANGSGYAIDDILNSRGWWTYVGAKVDRPYLSLPDILMMLDGTYKPKLFAVTSGTAAKPAGSKKMETILSTI